MQRKREEIERVVGTMTMEEAMIFSDFLKRLEEIRSRFQRRLGQCDRSDREAAYKERQIFLREREALLCEAKRSLEAQGK